MHFLSSLWFFLDAYLPDTPSQNFSTLTPAWLLGQPSASSCKPSYLIFLSYSSKLSSPPICPHFLSSAGSKLNTFLTPSQSNPPRGETLPTSWAREKTTTLCCVQLAPPPRSMALLVSPPPLSCVILLRRGKGKNHNFILVQIPLAGLQLWPSF